MKKIYTLTLDDEIPLSEEVINDVKKVAYCLFDELDKYDRPILVVDDKKNNLVRNELFDRLINGKYHYRFSSEGVKDNNYLYEPFIIDSRSFAFTVYDGSINEEEIFSILNMVLTYLELNYKFNIDSAYYDDELVNGRLTAINYFVQNALDVKQNNQLSAKKKVKSLVSPLVSMLR